MLDAFPSEDDENDFEPEDCDCEDLAGFSCWPCVRTGRKELTSDILPRLQTRASHKPVLLRWDSYGSHPDEVLAMARRRYSYRVRETDGIWRYLVVLCRSAVRGRTYLMRQTPSQLPVFGLSEFNGVPSNRHQERRTESTYGCTVQ
jgi:hypothetical protein